jgi:ankyrin repeat protein
MKNSTSKYEDFRELHEDGHDSGVVDDDGAVLYETPYSLLLNAFVRYNDVDKLARYLQNHDYANYGHVEVYNWDPFYIAAEYGSTEALDLLIKHYNAHSTDTKMKPLEKRGFRLLHVACLNAVSRLYCFCWILNPRWQVSTSKGDPSKWQDYETPILSAADTFSYIPRGFGFEDLEIRTQLARAEELMNKLLNRGASARDVLISSFDKHILDTVLSRAISRASYSLVKRLVTEGADVHTHTIQHISSFSSGPQDETVQGVTPLHLGSLHANLDGIQALFGLRGNKATVVEIAHSKDSAGRLPLHWAARGSHGPEYCYMIPRDEIVAHVASTIELLLTIAPDTINVKDNRGNNALWYMVSLFREHINQYYVVLKFLFELGADANMRNQNGMNMLHVLGFTQNGEAIDPVIIERLVVHGANLSDIDILGNTPLNQMAINLRQVEAVRALLRCGASMNVKNMKGDSPLHQAAHGRVFRYKDGTGIEGHGVPLDAKIKAQDEMMKVLEEAGSGLDLTNEKNIDGKTSRQLLEETRNKWRQQEQERLSRVSRSANKTM